MYIEKIKEKLNEFLFDYEKVIIPCTYSEVVMLDIVVDTLPEAYKKFLLFSGKNILAGRTIDLDIDYETILYANKDEYDTFISDASNISKFDNNFSDSEDIIIVAVNSQGLNHPWFCFIKKSEGDNPPVYGYFFEIENDLAIIKKIFDTFIDFILDIIERSFTSKLIEFSIEEDLDSMKFLKMYLKDPSIKSINYILNETPLCKIPERLFDFKNITNLSLSKMGLTYLDERIQYFKKLLYVDLQYNNFKVFPILLLKLEVIDGLLINDCKIEIIPENIPTKCSIRFLDLSNNPIEIFPTYLLKLCKIEELTLNNCKISNISKINEEILLNSTIEKIYLDFNLLTSFPIELLKLKKLRTIHLKGNKIPENEIKNIQKLYTEISIY